MPISIKITAHIGEMPHGWKDEKAAKDLFADYVERAYLRGATAAYPEADIEIDIKRYGYGLEVWAAGLSDDENADIEQRVYEYLPYESDIHDACVKSAAGRKIGFDLGF